MFRPEKAEKDLRICTGKNLLRKAGQMEETEAVAVTFILLETKAYGLYSI